MMRPQLIREITDLYPPDDNEAGRELLMLALCDSWRTLPIPVLESLLLGCIILDRKGS